jgi:DNA-binding NarL/FixJ family response regulator
MQQIRVILADNHQIFLEGLKNILENNETQSIKVLATTSSGKDLIELANSLDAQLIIAELNLHDLDGLDALQQLKKDTSLKKMVLSRYHNTKLVKSAFKAGVDGYVLKNADISELLYAVDELMKGNSYLGEGVHMQAKNGYSEKAVNGFQRLFKDGFSKKHSLTKREMEILTLITQALSNKQIAEELYISDQTVSVHRKNIMRKLGVSNTAGLIKEAYENFLVK